MIDARIAGQIRSVAARLRRFWFSLALTISMLGLAVVGSLLLWRPEFQSLGGAGPLTGISTWLLILGGVMVVGSYLLSRSVTRDPRRIALRIEQRFPELNARLLTALDFEPQGATGNYTFLQQRVIRETLHHDFVHGWRNVVPGFRLLVAYAMCACSVLGLVVVASLLNRWPVSGGAAMFAGLSNTPGQEAVRLEVQPGDVEIERGTSVLVTARFAGPLPEAVELWSRRGGEEEAIPMRRSLDDPLFVARLLAVDGPLEYRVRYAGQQTQDYQVRVFEYPRLERADAQLVYPGYTQLESKQLADVRRITAVEGTELTIICHVNKPLANARLIAATGETIALEPIAGEPQQYRAAWTLKQSARYRVELRDADGRTTPPPPPELIIAVTPNQPPELKLAVPGRDATVSPIEELQLTGSVKDDFGVVRHGLSFRVAGGEDREIDLTDADKADREHHVQYVLDMEHLETRPDQLVTYHLWAEDTGPDGQPRRTFSDMYFAEVRHFEEIFRQGQQPPGGGAPMGGGNQQQAEQLAELQKQIINATWTLLRRERDAADGEKLAADARVVRESQGTALEQLEELGQQVQDPESVRYLDEARQAMQSALTHLAAAEAGDGASLSPALAAEQSAYQALLKLRAREHEVVRSQSSSSSSGSAGGASRSQQQLDQLELKDSPNRYETERQAQSAEDPAEREVRQALNRLRELARRQEDMNKRLQELQSALEQASSEAERAEIERQLKRLRDEQQQILRDTEELQQRMEQPQNQERMRDEQQQLSETRENVRRASEALEQGQVSQALAAGTRAQRELEQMQDELRRKSANQFAEQMRDMRNEARQLADDQEQLVEQLTNLHQQESRSLRGSSQRAEAEETLTQQRERLEQVLEQMRRTVQEAEATEPLLSSRLYETYRQAQQDKPAEALEQAAEWLQRGISEEATAPAQGAQQGLDRLAEGIERAAESVIGDETEALRRAYSELDQLAEQLNEELTRAAPELTAEQSEARQSMSPGMSTEPGKATGEEVPARPQRTQEARPGEDRTGEEPTGEERTEASAAGEGRPKSPSEALPPPGSTEQGSAPAEAASSEPQTPGAPSAPGEARGTPASEPQPGNPSSETPGQSPGQTPGQAPGQSQGGSSRPMPGGPTGAAGQSGLGGSSGGDPNGLGGLAELIQDAASGAAPLTGEDYLHWSDRLRDVEEMLDDPELRAAAARIRDRARAARMEYRRHSREPKWDLVKDEIARPLVELRDRIAEEVRRRSGENELAPIDRDPVPPEFAEDVERYYERLGSGR